MASFKNIADEAKLTKCHYPHVLPAYIINPANINHCLMFSSCSMFSHMMAGQTTVQCHALLLSVHQRNKQNYHSQFCPCLLFQWV